MKTKRLSKTPQTDITCDAVGEVILHNFSSFTLEDVIRLFEKNDVCRELTTSWFAGWEKQMIQQKFIERIDGCFDACVYKVLKLPKKPKQVTELWSI